MKSPGKNRKKRKMLITNLVFFVIAAAVLITSSTYLVKSLNKIAHFLRISRFTAAFIIMAIATATPELFVGVSSAFEGVPALSLGNVIGSSILHLTLIMGIFALMAQGIVIKSHKVGKETHYVMASIILLIILFVIGKSLSRIDGVILLSFFLFNCYRMFKKRKRYKAKLKKRNIEKLHVVLNVATFILAFSVLYLSSKYVVKYASLLSVDLNLPNIVMGLFLISLATTLPELAFGIRAIKMGYKDMAIGDLTGGVLTNFGLVIGLVALIKPIEAEFTPFIISSAFLLISAFIFLIFLKSEKELKVGEGIALILLYVFFIMVQLLLKV